MSNNEKLVKVIDEINKKYGEVVKSGKDFIEWRKTKLAEKSPNFGTLHTELDDKQYEIL